MTVAVAAPDFSSDHPMRVIFNLFDLGIFEFIEESWPAASAVIFVFGGEKGNPAHNAIVHAFLEEVIVLICDKMVGYFGKEVMYHFIG